MLDGFSLKEAAAIAELPESVVRTAIEKKAIAPRAESVGKAVRYQFGVKELFYIKLLSAFPFDLDRDDKRSLRGLVFDRAETAGRWRAEGPDFVVKSGDLVLHVEVKHLRNHLADNLATYRRGRRRVVSTPDILAGEPVFAGTRIPLAHVSALVRNGIDAAEILEDFPALNGRDVAYAAIHARIKPHPGRPRKPLELRRRKSDESPAGHAAADR
ncbi:MAG TPA: DUF433 domain-containing protein [Stellaceae bacterium]|jgi:uncharacterized protein (DUF433 family)